MSIINKSYISHITPAQKNYIEILSNDLSLSRTSRNIHIAGIIKRIIKDLDELTRSEASLVIERMKEWKDVQDAKKA